MTSVKAVSGNCPQLRILFTQLFNHSGREKAGVAFQPFHIDKLRKPNATGPQGVMSNSSKPYEPGGTVWEIQSPGRDDAARKPDAAPSVLRNCANHFRPALSLRTYLPVKMMNPFAIIAI